MASHFLFHSQAKEIVPFTAQYAFPSQATRSSKTVSKITPREGGIYRPGNIIRIDLPSQGYLNAINSTLAFTVRAYLNSGAYADPSTKNWGLQNNVQSMFRRVRILYGSLVLEDIQDYNILVRMLTEVTVGDDYNNKLGRVAEGLGNWRERFRDNRSWIKADTAGVPSEYRRFNVNLASGLLTSRKLIPLKWMASQLRIEIELAPPHTCFAFQTPTGSPSPAWTYQVEDVAFLAEVIEFDQTYDAAFYKGLQSGGVPIQFASWRSYPFSSTGNSSQYVVAERARSIKAAFAVQVSTVLNGTSPTAAAWEADSHAFPRGGITEFQWRVGSRYFPAQAVKADGFAAEAYIELQKALNILGNYEVGGQIIPYTFGSTTGSAVDGGAGKQDGITAAKVIGINDPYIVNGVDGSNPWNVGDFTVDNVSKFVIGTSFETTNGMEISGINGEEQNELMLRVTQTTPTGGSAYSTGDMTLYVYTHYDNLMVVRPGNAVDLYQ